MTDGFNMAAFVLAAGQATPDRIALAVLGPARAERWSYARLTAAVQGVAAGLGARVPPGGRILMRLGNTPDFPVTFLGALWAGLVPVPTSAQLTPPEISAIARGLNPALIVAGDGIALPDHPAPVIDMAALRAMMALPGMPPDLGDAERAGYIVYTSGTSGVPRGVVHAHRAVTARRMMHCDWEEITAADRLLHAGAMNWTYTLGTGVIDPWTVGATALVPQAGTDAATLPLLLKRHDATIFAAAPGIYRQMLRQPIPAMPRLRHGLSAGEKLAEQLRDAWRTATGTDLHEAYGMSEISTFVSGSPARPAPPGTLGFPQDGRRVTIRDDGQIAVHRSDPGLMLEYLDAPADTAARFDGDWFLTGDLGRFTPEGAIAYDGRADDQINAGGYRVSPLEIEQAMAACPGVTDIAAVELRVRADTTIIAAFWVGPDLIADAQLSAFAAARLATYKCPRLWVRVDRLPRNANAKLNRRKLKTDWEANHGPT